MPGERSRWPGASLTCDYSPGDTASPVHREPDETAVLNHRVLGGSRRLPGLTCDTELAWQIGLGAVREGETGGYGTHTETSTFVFLSEHKLDPVFGFFFKEQA